MKILLDSCVWAGARAALTDRGHDVVTVADTWPTDPGDEEILSRAHAERRVLVTLDEDFGELAVVRGAPHAGIVRLVGLRAREQGPLAADALAEHGPALAGGALVTVEPDRVRVRATR